MECPGFEKELTTLINRTGLDHECNTPDFILARHLMDSLSIFKASTDHRDKWWGFIPEIGNARVEGHEETKKPNHFHTCQSIQAVIESYTDYTKEFCLMTIGSVQQIQFDAIERIYQLTNPAG